MDQNQGGGQNLPPQEPAQPQVQPQTPPQPTQPSSLPTPQPLSQPEIPPQAGQEWRQQPPQPRQIPQQPLSVKQSSTPASFAMVMPDHKPGGHKSVIIATIIIVLILIGGGAFAYWNGTIGSFFGSAPYHQVTLASDIFKGVSKINAATYTATVNITSGPKDKDAQAFSEAVPQSPTDLAFKRDQDKVRDLNTLLSDLNSYYFTHKKYPATLSALSSTIASTSAYLYTPLSNYTDFNLQVTFESGAAIDSLQTYVTSKEVTVQDKTVTFSKKSPYYLSLSSSGSSEPSITDISQLQSALAYIPNGTNINLAFTGASQTVGNMINGDLHGVLNADVNDVNISADVEFKKINDTAYFIINKLPTIFFDISSIKGKWVKITPQDFANYGIDTFGSNPDQAQQNYDAQKQKAIDQLKTILTIADKDQVLTFEGTPTKETINGVSAYKYNLAFDKTKMAGFYKDVTQQMQTQYGTDSIIKFDQATLDYLQSPEFSQVYDYMHKNTTLTLWADSNGAPVNFTYTIRVVPQDAQGNAQNRQINFSFGLALKNGAVSIDTPQNALSLEDAVIAMTGISKDVFEMGQQYSGIEKIRTGLTQYKEMTGKYPATLDELKKSPKQIISPTASTTSSSYISDYYYNSDQPLVKNLPQDIFTHQPFVYSSTGTDYKLQYSMTLPVYHAGDAIPYELYHEVYSNTSGRYGVSSITMNFLTGTNTADSKVMSEEAVLASQKDTDGDGLPDAFEQYIGTDPKKKDTDGDGHSDLQEVTTGSNPLGPGMLKPSNPYSTFFPIGI